MSTHNICFLGEIRKILYGYPLLSVAMSIFHLVEPGAILEARNPTIILTQSLNYTNCEDFVGE